MRAFLHDQLKKLHLTRGIKQYKEIASADKSEEEARQELNELLDILESVCNRYKTIPGTQTDLLTEPIQQHIIEKYLLTDKDFYGFNAAILTKWFEIEKEKYYRGQNHFQEKESEGIPFSELSEETKAKFNELLETLNSEKGFKRVPSVSREEIEALKHEDEIKKGVSLPAKQTDWEHRAHLERMNHLKIEYGRQFTESTWGGWKLKEGAPSFDDWIKSLENA